MSAQFSMFEPMTSEDTGNATFSQESQVGRMRSASQASVTTQRSGPAHVPVSPSVAQGKLKDFATRGIYGQLFIGSSPSARLQSYLESRLRARMAVYGSPEYVLTWKTLDMASGPQICALRASRRRTSGSGFIGWPTPRAQDGPKGGPNQGEDRLPGAVAMQLHGWPTPMAGTPAQNGYNEAGSTDSSRKTVEVLQGWPTPRANDGTGDKIPPGRQGGVALKTSVQELSGWMTPAASDGNGGKGAPIGVSITGKMPDGRKVNMGLSAQTRLAMTGWATPSARDWKSESVSEATQAMRNSHPIGEPLSQEVLFLDGFATNRQENGTEGSQAGQQPTFRNGTGQPSPSSAKTGSGGYQLNPEHSLWLQGIPKEWVNFAPQATRSIRSSRQSSSKRRAKPSTS